MPTHFTIFMSSQDLQIVILVTVTIAVIISYCSHHCTLYKRAGRDFAASTSTSAPMSPRPYPTDGFPTPTSKMQAETEAVLLKHIPDSNSFELPPTLQKKAHMQYLIRNLVQGFPTRYSSQDASQPWLMFWTVQSFGILQVALDPVTKQKVIDKIMTCQHPDGGFGGGPGQAAQLLPTYGAVCTLAIVGRPGPGGGWDQIDREKMYEFFMSVKQKDGSFMVARHSEVDVRGIYCLLVVSTLLNILTPELVEGTAEFIASCQTYEGGFASASHHSISFNNSSIISSPCPPLGEAHGGYTFCALASWVLLQPYLTSLSQYTTSMSIPSINLKNLLRWLTQMQGTEIELGGFKGRTNKLVDGCYSWWCGGSFAMIEALGVGGIQNTHSGEVANDPSWTDIDGGLYDQKALQEYILYAAQHPVGGLRDKPPKNADSYHTLYCLSGLSSAQHHLYPSATRRKQLQDAWEAQTDDGLQKAVFIELLSWTEEEGVSKIVGGEANRLNATHPITNLTITHTEAIMRHFYKQSVPLKTKTVPTPSSYN